MDQHSEFDHAGQLEQFRQWIGERAVFLQTFPTAAAWRVVPAHDAKKFMTAIAELEGQRSDGIHFGINPMKPDTIRVPGNKDIARRHRLFLDVDHPDHDLKIPASNAGKKISRDIFERVVAYLGAKGWSAPVKIDSGNGHHGFWHIDLPNDDESAALTASFLSSLQMRFGPLVDTAVGDARRLGRVPGTWNKKGEQTIERPHRPCIILDLPELAGVVTAGMIQAVIVDIEEEHAAQPERHFNTGKTGGTGDRPGDDYNSRVSWAEILEPAGWKIERQLGKELRWARPGKHDGASATTGYCKGDVSGDLLHIFSSNAPPFQAGESYSKFCVFALLNHAGDFSAAARALAANGYGTPGNKDKVEPPSVWSDPQPIPNGLLPVLQFDFAMLPSAFGAFITDVAERMQCPPDFPAVAIMIAEAGVVGKKIAIRPKRHDDWTVVPNLWGAVIGRPGIMKSPAIAQPMKLLRRLEEEAKGVFEDQQRVYKDRLAIADIQAKQRKNVIEKAIKAGNDPIEAADKITVDEPAEPTRRRYLVNDSTVEKLGELLNQNPNGLTVFRDEISGFLERLEREGQEGARAFYLEAWDGTGKFTYDRIGRGTLDIESVTLSLMGGSQPGKFCSYLQSAICGGVGDDGLSQRFQMLVYPDVSRQWRNVDRWPDTTAKQEAWEVFKRLNALNPMAIRAECYDGEIPYLRFEQDAQGVFDDWRADLERKVRSGEDHPAIESHLAKYRSLVPSLALLTHLADHEGGPVPLVALDKAITWATYLESHARRIYAVAIDPTTVGARALAKRIKEGDVKDGFSLREVYRRHWSGLSGRESVEPAVDLLVCLGWLKEVVEQPSGKSRTFYRINPRLCAENGQAGR